LDGLVIVSNPEKSGDVRVLSDHTDKVTCLAVSPDGLWIASGALDGKARIHRLDGRLTRTYQGLSEAGVDRGPGRLDAVLSLAWIPGGGLAAGMRSGALVRLSAAEALWEPWRENMGGPVRALVLDGEAGLAGAADGLFRLSIPPPTPDEPQP